MSAEAPKEGNILRTAKLLFAGGIAGAVARTCVSPLDRVKLIFQVQDMTNKPGAQLKYTGFFQTFSTILKEEGLLSFWRGNGVNIVRIFPYSAFQFMSYEQYKKFLLGENQKDLTIPQRLLAGAMAGMTSTALTHPLDTLRLHLAVNTELKSVTGATTHLYRTAGVMAFMKGIGPTLMGIAPYVGINFASYDIIKNYYAPRDSGIKLGVMDTLLIGAVAGTVAQTVCYPLDTIRRRMQMGSDMYAHTWDAIKSIYAKNGMNGFFKGYIANTLKVVPNNAIRFLVYEFMKSILDIKKARSDT
eukprot:TRINITY_DN3209_c0_g1_i1.p1 TRINITY_DN3209_c0_g1~~TRINITY_DN3209_c0_g1_i1.p1  ORF type:complete len:301 (+),score=70.62 TRINITY_DN3209_c0_g1_i1:59-961(+)